MCCGLLANQPLLSFVTRNFGRLDRDGGGEIDFRKDRGGVSSCCEVACSGGVSEPDRLRAEQAPMVNENFTILALMLVHTL